MFKNPFSFRGRIRRTEYALSYVLLFCVSLIWSFFIDHVEESSLKTTVFIAGIYWFIIAQSTKRCHDMGQSGFYQLIPFYGLAILFIEGERKKNQYGEDPKKEGIAQVGTRPTYSFWPIIIPKDKTRSLVVSEILMFALLLAVWVTWTNINAGFDSIFLLWMEGTCMIGLYFLLLLYSHNAKSIHDAKSYYLFHRIVFAIIYCTIQSIYEIIFIRIQPIEVSILLNLVLDTCLLFMVTYIPYLAYKLILSKKVSNVLH